MVMKALSKERDWRYETATGFARDVERFLEQRGGRRGTAEHTLPAAKVCESGTAGR